MAIAFHRQLEFSLPVALLALVKSLVQKSHLPDGYAGWNTRKPLAGRKRYLGWVNLFRVPHFCAAEGLNGILLRGIRKGPFSCLFGHSRPSSMGQMRLLDQPFNQGHYWIKRSRISWAGQWSAEEIASGRKRDQLAKQRHFAPVSAAPVLTGAVTPTAQVPISKPPVGFWKGLWQKLNPSLGGD